MQTGVPTGKAYCLDGTEGPPVEGRMGGTTGGRLLQPVLLSFCRLGCLPGSRVEAGDERQEEIGAPGWRRVWLGLGKSTSRVVVRVRG